jgi:hypothetical protein
MVMSTTTQVGTESETRGQYKAKAYSAASASSRIYFIIILFNIVVIYSKTRH